MKPAQLKEELKLRGLSIQGNAKELVARLTEAALCTMAAMRRREAASRVAMHETRRVFALESYRFRALASYGY